MKQQEFQEGATNGTENQTGAEAGVTAEQQTAQPEAAAAEVEQLKAQVEELKDKYLRQAAEFDNFRRRTAKERIEYMQTAGKEVIESLLDVLDDSDRAMGQMEKSRECSTTVMA